MSIVRSRDSIVRMRDDYRQGAASRVEPAALLQQFEARQAVVGVVGLGYVGLPLSLCAHQAGYSVIGFDINPTLIEELNAARSPLNHIPHEKIAEARKEGRFTATNEPDRLAAADAILICVPTPLGPHREPDLSFVEDTARMLAKVLRPGQLIVLESTTYPGTTRDLVKPILEGSGLCSGVDFFLAYSPEREDPGNAEFGTARIPKVIAGDGEDALRLAEALYDGFVCRTVPVSSLETAEAVKLTENIFRAVNIALVNELKVVYRAIGVDIFEVIDAAKTKPFGYMPFYPGPGLGGHCIPIDPFYLTWKARELGINTRFIELAGEINTSMPGYVVSRLREELDGRFGKGLAGSRILVVGIAYKKDVADMRESPALTIMECLDEAAARVDYHDPYVPIIPPTRKHSALAGKASVPLEGYSLVRYDAAVVVTDHSNVEYDKLLRYSKLILDTRNALAPLCAVTDSNLVAKA